MARLTKAKRRRKLVIQFVEYMISGGAFFWSGYLVFALCYQVLDWSLWWANSTGYLFGWVLNFILQRYWVFRNPHLEGHLGKVSGRYIFISAVNLGLSYVLLAWLKGLGVSPLIGQFIVTGLFFTPWNFIWYKYWVFPDRYTRKAYTGKKKHLRARR